MDIRLLHEDNTTLEDKTVDVNNYYSGTPTMDIVAADDYVYIGSRFPFNHLYFKFGTANTAASTITLTVWDGSAWASTKELFDETLSSGASWGQNGYISWSTDKATAWGREDTQDASGTELVTGLGSLQIYDHYWIRLAFSADLDAGTTLSWVGHLFSDDNHLGAKYPDLVRTNTMNGWDDTDSKSSWEEQHVTAAKEILQELKTKKVIFGAGNILDKSDFRWAAVHKVAEMAYDGMGTSFEDNAVKAMTKYNEALINAIGSAVIDKDMDAQPDRDELGFKQGKLTRGSINRYNRALA